MQYITLRQWRTSSPESFKEFPFIVTYKGVPTYKVFSITEEHTTLQELPPENFSEKIEKEELVKTFVTKPEWAKEVVGFEGTIICEAPNQRCKNWATKRVNFESPDHVNMTLCFCEEHLKKLKSTGVEIFGEPEDL